MHKIDDVYDILNRATFLKATDDDMKRSNANVDTDGSMGAMLTYGSETARLWVDDCLLPDNIKSAVEDNWIYIHDKDYYGLTETCCQIELDKLFTGGFYTGHGYLREPKSITTAAALACIAIQSNQNEQHGGQSIPAFDYYMAPYVELSYKKHYEYIKQLVGEFKNEDEIENLAWNATVEEAKQAMEALIHNLNTMHSRAGAQVPFSSLNYGTDTSRWGRLVIYSLLWATEKGLGRGETPIFPVQIFKVKEGINYNIEDANYDLFQYAMAVSGKRLFPNFSFIDAPFNLQYYKEGDPMTEVAYMGCRTRVLADCNGDDVVGGRGNLSFSTINLVKCALAANRDQDSFWNNVVTAMEITKEQLLHRYDIQKKRHAYNYPFLMGNGIWKDSDKLQNDDEVEEVLKHGTLSIGFIGLAEAMKALYGKHHGEDDWVWNQAYIYIAGMRKLCDKWTEETGLNFTLLATPAEGLSGKFVSKDREEFGELEGITDKIYYTNSFHIPVYYKCDAATKIEKEAPFHALCNAGHISYIEVDGDPSKNIEAFEQLVRYAHDNNMGYFAVNHPVDRDPICGYRGIIGDTCPCCGRKEYEAIDKDRRGEFNI